MNCTHSPQMKHDIRQWKIYDIQTWQTYHTFISIKWTIRIQKAIFELDDKSFHESEFAVDYTKLTFGKNEISKITQWALSLNDLPYSLPNRNTLFVAIPSPSFFHERHPSLDQIPLPLCFLSVHRIPIRSASILSIYTSCFPRIHFPGIISAAFAGTIRLRIFCFTQ